MIGGCSGVDPFLFNEYPANGEIGNRTSVAKTQHSSVLSGVKTIIIGGQSNMSTSIGTTVYTVVSANALSLSIYDGGFYSDSDPVLGCNVGGVSSICMPIADSMISRGKATTCVVVPIGMGGTPFAAWEPAPTGTLHGRLTTAILRCRARGFEPDAIFWGQGETDASLGTSAASVKASIWAIVDGIRNAPISCAAPFYIGKYTMLSGAVDATIQTGIANSIDAGRSIVAGYDADTNCTVAGGFRLGDNIHLSNTGRALAATGWTTIAFP